MPKRRSLTELRDLALDQDSPREEARSSEEAPDESHRKARNPSAKRNKWVQLNIFVPAETRLALKMRALRDGRDMSDIVAALLEDYLGG